MAYKRFRTYKDKKSEGAYVLIDHETNEIHSFPSEHHATLKRICEMMNRINDEKTRVEMENSSLKGSLDYLTEYVNEKYMIMKVKDMSDGLYSNCTINNIKDMEMVKHIFEICMILIDGAIDTDDMELAYESLFQFERRIRKFNDHKKPIIGGC